MKNPVGSKRDSLSTHSGLGVTQGGSSSSFTELSPGWKWFGDGDWENISESRKGLTLGDRRWEKKRGPGWGGGRMGFRIARTKTT